MALYMQQEHSMVDLVSNVKFYFKLVLVSLKGAGAVFLRGVLLVMPRGSNLSLQTVIELACWEKTVDVGKLVQVH
jgi:hypothetical protein